MSNCYKGGQVQTLDWYYVGTMSDWYKPCTGTNTRLVPMSDWYKPWTGTNVDWYKCWTGTNLGLVQTLDWYKCQIGTNVYLLSCPVFVTICL